MSLSPRRTVLGPVPGQAGTERKRIDADVEVTLEPKADGGVRLRLETTGTPNFEKHVEAEFSSAETDRLASTLESVGLEG